MVLKEENRKGQSAIEFSILVGAVLFFFLIFLIAVESNISDKTFENRNLLTKEVALAVQNEINLAAESSNGYHREFKIPDKILSLEYEVNITEGSVYIRTDDGRHALSLPAANVTGDVMKGLNSIRKENGVICLNIDGCGLGSSPPGGEGL